MPRLLGWTGMRGVVSLAAALAIPVTLAEGTAFPHRNLILFITFVAILLTLLVQGLTLPYFITRGNLFNVYQGENEEAATRELKKSLRQHVYQFFQDKHQNDPTGESGVKRGLEHWAEKTKVDADDEWMNEKTKAVFMEMLEIQRLYLTELNHNPKINEELIRQQLYQIDLEEERLKTI